MQTNTTPTIYNAMHGGWGTNKTNKLYMMSRITSPAVNVSFSLLLSDDRSFYISWRTFLDARLNEELGHFLLSGRRFAYGGRWLVRLANMRTAALSL